MTTLTIVRRGQTDWNREWRFQGSTDIGLCERGIAQAESVFQVGFKVQEGLCSLYENYQNRKILLVSHGFVFRTISCHCIW